MNFRLEELDINNELHIVSIAKWANDKELYSLSIPIRSNDFTIPVETVDTIRRSNEDNLSFTKTVTMLFDADIPIGHFSLQMNPGQLLRKDVSTAWPGLTIGERKYWGKGAGAFAMKEIERLAKILGAKRIELGTFQFNLRAQSFYKKLGYQEFARIKNFTYFEGRFWDDLRLEKFI